MKLLLVISVLALSACGTIASDSSEACAWVDAIKAVVGKFTPTGQQNVWKELQSFQFYLGAALQPVYDYLGNELKAELASIKATDSAQLDNLKAVLGVGNYVNLIS